MTLDSNPHSACIPVGRTCDIRCVAKKDVVSDVYAGHDLARLRPDRRLAGSNTLSVWAGYPGAGQVLQTHDS